MYKTCVELDQVKKLISRLYNEPEYLHKGETYYAGLCALDLELNTLPTVQIKQGKPLRVLEGPCNAKRFFICSCCAKKIDSTDKWCKHCGTKLDILEEV